MLLIMYLIHHLKVILILRMILLLLMYLSHLVIMYHLNNILEIYNLFLDLVKEVHIIFLLLRKVILDEEIPFFLIL